MIGPTIVKIKNVRPDKGKFEMKIYFEEEGNIKSEKHGPNLKRKFWGSKEKFWEKKRAWKRMVMADATARQVVLEIYFGLPVQSMLGC